MKTHRLKAIPWVIALLMVCQPLDVAADWLRGLGGLAKAAQATTMTEKDLVKYVSSQVGVMDAQANVAPASSKYAKRLNSICQGLANADGLSLNFKVYITDELNAFACPDGSVRVYSALMDLLDDNELLGVIGHEIGHVAKKHSYKAWKDALYRSAVDDVLSGVSDTYANLSGSTVGLLTGAAITAKYSKKHENEADDYGYEFLKKHNKNPWAMALAFEKLKKMSGDSGNASVQKWLNIFSSHPDFDTRIKRMSRRATRDGFVRPK